MIALLILLPLAGALFMLPVENKSVKLRDALMLGTTAAMFLLSIYVFMEAEQGRAYTVSLPIMFGLGLTLSTEGFSALYTLIVSFMWLVSALFSVQYFAKPRNAGRYAFFTLLTLSATIGVFLSADLYTTFLFFEIMSLSSYPWVAHEETPNAMRAAGTYLAIAVLGGMVTLMGMYMVYAQIGTLAFEALEGAKGDPAMTLPALLILFGFCVKAGMFPVHVWLPRAHPVAPAPASALLSGALTKTGMYGVIVISMNCFLENVAFGSVMLSLGLITMLVGALTALYSVDLKHTLACSSISQIGYILTGIAEAVLLGKHDEIPAAGALAHMVSHSLLKLTLFLAAGAVYMNIHKLGLNDVRGFGRGKPVLHIVFLIGALGLAGVPLFSGYIGKTLIHEGLVEWIAEAEHDVWAFKAAEWVFLFAAGLTAAYMLKLYILLFWEKNKTCQAEYDAMNRIYLKKRSALALLTAALAVPLLGAFPGLTVEPLERLTEKFMHAHAPEGVHYFNLQNLQSGAISLLIGTLVYLLYVRKHLYTAKDGYINRWPRYLDLEESIYRPVLLKLMPRALNMAVAILARASAALKTLVRGADRALARGVARSRVAAGKMKGTVIRITGVLDTLPDTAGPKALSLTASFERKLGSVWARAALLPDAAIVKRAYAAAGRLPGKALRLLGRCADLLVWDFGGSLDTRTKTNSLENKKNRRIHTAILLLAACAVPALFYLISA